MKRWLVVALALGLGACGGSSDRDTQREAAGRYVTDAQKVMQRGQHGFAEANQAYVAYSRGELEPDETVTRIRAAQRTIQDARDGVAVLDPAPAARPLHDRLLAYLDLNEALAEETTGLATYVPAAERAVAPVTAENRRLAARLSDASDSAAQARALQRFADALGVVIRRLGRLQPPPVLLPAHRDQVHRLDATRTLAQRLRRALLERDAARVAVLLKAFRSAGGRSDGLPALERAARDGYAQRLDQVRDRYRAVRRETARLQQTLR